MWKKLKEAEIGQLKVGRGGGAVVSVITSIPTFWVRINLAVNLKENDDNNNEGSLWRKMYILMHQHVTNASLKK